MATYDPAKSQVNEETLAVFVGGALEHDITSVPGVGPKTAEALAACDDAIENTFQLLGKFLVLKRSGMTSQEHCDAFVQWLQSIGVKSHRSTITNALLEKAGSVVSDMHGDAEEHK